MIVFVVKVQKHYLVLVFQVFVGKPEWRNPDFPSVLSEVTHRLPNLGRGNNLAYLFFHPRREKKNSSISASATCNRCYRRHSRGETGRPLPTRGRPRSPTEQVISALPRPRPPASSQGWEKKGPLSASPPQKRLLPRRFSPQPMAALSSTAFHFSQRRNARKCENVTTSPPSGRLRGKKRRDRAFSKRAGRRDSQLPSVSANFAPEAKHPILR